MEATAGKKIFRINVERDYSIRTISKKRLFYSSNLFRRVGKDKMIINYINHLIDGVDRKNYASLFHEHRIKPSLTIPQGWFEGESNFTSLPRRRTVSQSVGKFSYLRRIPLYSWEATALKSHWTKSCVPPSNVSKHCRAQMSQAFYNKNISIRDIRANFSPPKR